VCGSVLRCVAVCYIVLQRLRFVLQCVRVPQLVMGHAASVVIYINIIVKIRTYDEGIFFHTYISISYFFFLHTCIWLSLYSLFPFLKIHAATETLNTVDSIIGQPCMSVNYIGFFFKGKMYTTGGHRDP